MNVGAPVSWEWIYTQCQQGGVAAEQRASKKTVGVVKLAEIGSLVHVTNTIKPPTFCCCFCRCHRLEKSSKQSATQNGKKLLKHTHIHMKRKQWNAGETYSGSNVKIIHFAKFQWNFTFNIQQCYFYFHGPLIVSNKKKKKIIFNIRFSFPSMWFTCVYMIS